MQGEKELEKNKLDNKLRVEKETLRTQAQQKLMQDKMKNNVEMSKRKMNMTADQVNKNKNNSEN